MAGRGANENLNRKGRPKGTPNKATLARVALVEGAKDELRGLLSAAVRVIHQAMDGDAVNPVQLRAAETTLDRFVPRLKAVELTGPAPGQGEPVTIRIVPLGD